MSLNSEAGASLLFYTGINFAGSSQSVAHGATGTLAKENDSWAYKSVAMSAMHAFCWSEVNTADASINYQNHTESLISASITDLTALYSATAFPLYYLGIAPTVATAVWLDMSAVSGDVNVLAATSLVGGSATTITTLSRPGLNGVAGFVGLTTGSSVVASCSYGTYDSKTGQVAWTGLNAGTLVLEYTGGAVTILSATGFPDGWTFASPVIQADGSWKITVAGGAASGNVISTLTSDKDSIVNDGASAAVLTATVQDSSGKPVQNVTVSWTTDLGTLNHKQQATDATGRSHAKLSDLGDTGTAVVTATLPDGTYKYVKITVVENGGALLISSLTSDKSSIANNGTDAAVLTATVTDGSGEIASGVTVSWSTTLGNLSASTSVTDGAGQATVMLTDSGDTGTAVVTGSLDNGCTKSTNISLTNSDENFAMYCSTDALVASYNDYFKYPNIPTNKVTIYGAAGATIQLSVDYNAQFNDTNDQTTTLKLDSTGFGLAEICAYGACESLVTAVCGEKVQYAKISFYNKQYSCNSLTPADSRVPCTFYSEQFTSTYYSPYMVTLSGSAHFSDGSQSSPVSYDSAYSASIDFFDDTSELVTVTMYLMNGSGAKIEQTMYIPFTSITQP